MGINKDWGETQVVDEFQETEVVRNDDDDGEGQSERTVLLTDDDDDFNGEVGSYIRTKDRDLVDPDTTTDEDEGCGSEGPGDTSLQLTGGSQKSDNECSRKSFVAIRVAALRSFGSAAARSMNCTPIVCKSESSNLAEGKSNTSNQGTIEDHHTRTKTRRMEVTPCGVSDLNIVGTKKDEIVLGHDAENSFRCIDGYNRDGFPYQDEETNIRSEISKKKLESHYSRGGDGTAASYISSQEPGVQSQAIALGIVDKFLSVNDLGSSQDINNGSNETVISPPIASVKRAQSFVMKSDKNAAGNPQVYEWNDSLEDGGGGEFFSRREYSFFDNKRSKQILCNLPSGNEGAKSRTSQKLAHTNSFSSKLKHRQFEIDARSSKTRPKKNLFNETEVQENTETIGKLEKSNVHTIDEGVYDVGPATQMAAEAIQALCHSSPANCEWTNLQSKSGELLGGSTNIQRTRNTPTRKRSNKYTKSEGITTRSKHKTDFAKSRTSCNSSRRQSSKLKTKMVLEENAVEIVTMVSEKKIGENSKGVLSLNSGKSPSPIVGNEMKNVADKELEKSPASVALYKEPLDVAKSIVGTSQMYTSPVAHRTRHSKAATLLNFSKTLSNCPTEDKSAINLRGHTRMKRENQLILNASVVPKVDKSDCNISLKATIIGDFGFSGLAVPFETERMHAKGTGASDAYRERKRRKKNIEGNQTNDCKMDIVSKDVELPVNRRKHKVFIRSIAEILDRVKRKRRTVSSNRNFESNGLPSNTENMANVSGMRSRSSLLSDILKPYFANDSHFKTELSTKPGSNGSACTYSVSSIKQAMHHDNLEISKEGVQSRLLQVVKESKPEGSPDAISQPGLACPPTIDINAVLPVCISQDSSKISAHKSLTRPSITRELIRLEASNTSPSKLNDMRRRKDMGSFQVCFSNHLSKDVIKHQKKILARFGIQVVSSSSEATHFVADKFVRTKNMLEAMGMGKPVVTPMWLESCGQASCYIDERNYILRDAKKEKEIGFSMPVSLARAFQQPLLQGKALLITQNTKPNQELISSLAKASGGQVFKGIMRSTKKQKLPNDLLIISSEEDFAVCAPLLEKGTAVFSSELLLNGIVVQKLEYERHQLFLDQVWRQSCEQRL